MIVARLAVIMVPCLGMPAMADENPSAAWMLAESGTQLVIHEVGTMNVRGTEMIGVDSLTFDIRMDWPWFTVPAGPARVIALFDPSEVEFSKAAILFSDATPVCGEEVGGMPVDTGTGAFLDRPVVEALDALARSMGSDCNLYDCFMAGQMPDADFAKMIKLPDGSAYPAFSTGYGDGVYPVFLLRDAAGAPTSAYVDFLGISPTYKWLTPPACQKPTS